VKPAIALLGVALLAGCGGDSGAKACEVTNVDESRAGCT
jgi:hypothetical protein